MTAHFPNILFRWCETRHGNTLIQDPDLHLTRPSTNILYPQCCTASSTNFKSHLYDEFFGKQIQEPCNGFLLLSGHLGIQKVADYLENTGLTRI